MSDNLILEHLRAIRSDIAGLKTDMLEVKERLGLLEQQAGSAAQQYASLSRRVDRIGDDIALIKRRLDLVDAP